jgi:predicted HNH restriction endonuclease
MICIHCKHIGSTQVCHIKPISDFNDFSLISEINNIKNLIGLCPNCHIDLDKHKKFEVTRTATLHSMIIKHTD